MRVYTIEDLAKVVQGAKDQGLIVGLCHGCFDILHIGHVRHFTAARSQCDVLFVSVTGDRFVNKGPERPVIPEHERAEVVSNLRMVSGAVINQSDTSEELLARVRPTLYFKGQEYKDSQIPNFLREKEVAEGLGVEVRFTFEQVASSSRIIYMLHKTDTPVVPLD